MVNGNAVGSQVVDQLDQLVDGFQQWCIVEQLRADVAIDSGDIDVGQAGADAVGRQCVFKCDAELVLFQTGGNIGMGLGVHVRIDSQRHPCSLAHVGRDGIEAMQLWNGFDVEAQYVVR